MDKNEKNIQEAELEAKADATANKNDMGDIYKNMSLTVEFKKKYRFDGKEYDRLDLTRLRELTTLDAEYIDEVMEDMKHHPTHKYEDTAYCKHVAMLVTGLPVEFFNMLSWRDMNEIKGRIYIYFLFG